MSDRFHHHYSILGLGSDSDWDDLRAAYRSHIRKWHPDRFHNQPGKQAEAEERTKRINNAYDELSAYYRAHGRLPLHIVPAPTESCAYTPSSSTATRPAASAWSNRWAGIPLPQLAWATGVGLVLLSWFLSRDGSVEAPPPRQASQAPAVSLASDSTAPERYFTIGSTLGEVYAAQGIPSRTDGPVWYYGTSRVTFADGHVVEWNETPEHPLRTRLAADRSHSSPHLFAKGSSKSEVRKIQGNPVTESEKIWDYGVSRVYFDGDRVVDWYESPLNPLNVKR